MDNKIYRKMYFVCRVHSVRVLAFKKKKKTPDKRELIAIIPIVLSSRWKVIEKNDFERVWSSVWRYVSGVVI